MKEEMAMHVDAELLSRCARGEEKAYEELVGRLEKPLINFIYRYVGERHLAEDLFQETFVRVLRTLPEFRPEASLSTWIFTIARNLCLDHLKAKKRHREVSLEKGAGDERGNVLTFREAPLASPSTSAEGAEMGRAAVAALARLAPPKREALVLRLYSEMPYEEIARIVRAPVGTVKFRVHEAVRDLASWMGVGEREEAAEG